MRLMSDLITLVSTPLLVLAAHAEAPTASAAETGATTRVQVVPVVFNGNGKQGDYAWMRGQPGYEHTYFVFNDNEVQFLAHQKDFRGTEGCEAGAGNAGIRPWQCEAPPRAGGVPTGNGADDGYQALTPHVEAIVDQAVTAIKGDLEKWGFDRVVYSSCIRGSSSNCTLNDDLGTGTFHPSAEVRGYIVSELKKISR